jgi:hypothetical protein
VERHVLADREWARRCLASGKPCCGTMVVEIIYSSDYFSLQLFSLSLLLFHYLCLSLSISSSSFPSPPPPV